MKYNYLFLFYFDQNIISILKLKKYINYLTFPLCM